MANEILPPLYRRWFDTLLPRPLEPERLATCDDCVMVTKPDRPVADSYDPRTKCCTYVPELNNFLVGGILLETRPAYDRAKQILEDRIRGGAAVSPVGIAPMPLYGKLYEVKTPGTFGHTPAMRCPFYVEEGGMCGIYDHREAVCSTWFCHYNRAVVGKGFWALVSNVLRQIEKALTWYCIDTAGFDLETRRALATHDPRPRTIDQWSLAGISNPAIDAGIWGNLHGRKREFFEACGRAVADLTWPEVLALGGVQLGFAVRMLVEAQESLAAPLPEYVAGGAHALLQIGRPGMIRFRSPHVRNTVEVPMAVANGLRRFANTPVPEAREHLRAEGIDLDDATLRALIDLQVLVPRRASAAVAPPPAADPVAMEQQQGETPTHHGD